MTTGRFRFAGFLLDPADRRLTSAGRPVDLNARYLDALALLVSEAGRLVTKDRFLNEVWRGVPVTDEALTQCIKALRRQLGDEASRPQFIETVPKHGYRFIAPVERVDGVGAPPAPSRRDWRELAFLGGAGTLGGAAAGMIGGLFYGFAGASLPLAPGMGAASVMLVLLWLTLLVGVLGGAGVAFGIAGSGLVQRGWQWPVIGGTMGGLAVGAIVKLLGLDALTLLFGQAPRDITGAAEGALLGGAIGLGAWLAQGSPRLRRSLAFGGLAGGTAGLAIALLGGRLMGGSLDLLAGSFPGSRLRLDGIGELIGETGFGPVTQAVTATLEGSLFGACVVGAMTLGRRSLGKGR